MNETGRRRSRIPPLRRGVYILPNLFTSAGLLSGFYAIIATLDHRYQTAARMILVAQLCDLLDGRIARWTRSSSLFGVEYDSLSDLVAFGVAPAILVFEWALKPWGRPGWLAVSLYVVCAAIRLARFNVQVSSVEKRHFVGLPTPAAALVIASTVLLHFHLGGKDEPNKHLTMLLVIFAVAGLMVSEVRYFSFKEIRLHQRHPFPVFLGVLLIMYLTVWDYQWMVFLGVTSYALSGPVTLVWRLWRGRGRAATASVAPLDKGAPPG